MLVRFRAVFDPLIIGIIGAAGILVGCATLGTAAFYIRSSRPIALQRVVHHLSERVEIVEGNFDAMQAAWRDQRTQLESTLEEMTGLKDAVERKRRSTAASMGAMRPAPAGTEEARTTELDEVRRQFRAQGFQV